MEDVKQNFSSPNVIRSSVLLLGTLWPFQLGAAAANGIWALLEEPSNRGGQRWSHPRWMLSTPSAIAPSTPWWLDYITVTAVTVQEEIMHCTVVIYSIEKMDGESYDWIIKCLSNQKTALIPSRFIVCDINNCVILCTVIPWNRDNLILLQPQPSYYDSHLQGAMSIIEEYRQAVSTGINSVLQ